MNYVKNYMNYEKNSVSSEVYWTNISLIKYFRFISHVRKADSLTGPHPGPRRFK